MNETWKPYFIEGAFDENTRLEFSIFGEVKSFSINNPEGKIIKGGLQQGYPIIRFKRLKPMDEQSEIHINKLLDDIKILREQLKPLSVIIRNKSTSYNDLKTAERKSTPLKKELEKLTKKLTKDRQKINKKRSIYHHILIHKAVAALFLENDDPVNKIFVLHKNFEKSDNRVENLKWATKDEVVKHSFKSPNWIKHNLELERSETLRRGYSKLSYNDVVFIKRKLSKGEPMARLARRFGVSDMQIHRIKTGENWGDVKIGLAESEEGQ